MNKAQKIDFGDYHFYVGVRHPDEFNGIPGRLPFNIYIDTETALPTLKITKEIDSALSVAYGQGSMLSTPLGIGRLGANRMQEFVDKLLSFMGDVSGKKIIEIGCGEGHLLARLQEYGADVMGLEIGPQGKEAEKHYGFTVIDKPLEDVSFDFSFDAIISYGCLEHIIDIKSFVSQCRGLLSNDGIMFHSVPNTDNTLEKFRFDDLCHQHVNYFSPANANRFFKSLGFKAATSEPTAAGNEMYMMARAGRQEDASLIADSSVEDGLKEWQGFSERLQLLKNNFNHNLSTLLEKGSVGFYAGGHILASMSDLGDRVEYFDGDSAKHGKSWLAGLPVIRDPGSLVDEPVSTLVIGPEHHMASIKSYLFEEIGIPESIDILALSELYGPDSEFLSK